VKIGVVGLGNRIAHVFYELKQINNKAELVAYVDPQPIGKNYAIKNNFFPTKNYLTLGEMISNESLDLLMIGSPNHLHLEHIKEGLIAGLKLYKEKPIVVDGSQTFELAKLIKEFGPLGVLVGLELNKISHALRSKFIEKY
jgi:Predicted dehydrogenases and related proteins